jgi:ribokinase
VTAGRGRVVVVGSINVDLVVRVADHPAPGETVTAHGFETCSGGKGGNQAIAAARAGAPVHVVGAVGDDDGGAEVLAAFDRLGIGTRDVATMPGVATGRAIVAVDARGENTIVVVPGANAELDGATVERAAFGPDDVVLLQNELRPEVTVRAAAAARAAGARVVWNAAPAPASVADVPADVDLVVVNEHELDAVARLLGVPAADRDAAMDGVATALGAPVLCTLGPAGSVLATDGRHVRVQAPVVRAVDTTAAGDTFIGYLAADLLDGPVTADALRHAGTAAALAVTRAGASPSIPERDEVTAFASGLAVAPAPDPGRTSP